MHLGRTTLSKIPDPTTKRHRWRQRLGRAARGRGRGGQSHLGHDGQGALGGFLGAVGTQNVQGEIQQKLDVLANDAMLRGCEWGGLVAGMASEELDEPYAVPGEYARGNFLLVFDPLDGSSNTDVNVSVGTIFRYCATTSVKRRLPRTFYSWVKPKSPPDMPSTDQRPCWWSRLARARTASPSIARSVISF